MLAVLTLWFGISVPLVFLGAYFGYKKEPIEFPVITSNIPRQIPTQPWYLDPTLTILLGERLFIFAYFYLFLLHMLYLFCHVYWSEYRRKKQFYCISFLRYIVFLFWFDLICLVLCYFFVFSFLFLLYFHLI